ncbi:MAG TPA: ActS/PrrB/RegB family redox-sensitive histidine kinase [Candidatus Sulfotelmatobacter sp.]|nr:ActS/PrrB/RegB family redox-sensitive histidine kinase [Candidatus Sulfotelmatobacter sp.]
MLALADSFALALAPLKRAAVRGSRAAVFHSAGGGRVRLRTLVLIRWIAVVGQALALLFVHYGLEFQLPLTMSLSVVGASVVLNVAVFLLYPSAYRLTDRGATIYLGFDLLQLAVLVFLTGGLSNPFSLLFLVPVTISATILSLRSTVCLGLFALAAVSVLAFYHLPLPWTNGGLTLPGVYIAGTWAALALGMGFVSVYASQVAAEARRMSDALGETQLALAREQQLSALGGLAAAAAHELGTPLSTIALVAKELARDLPADGPAAEDVALLMSEAVRCRDILARLSRKPTGDGPASFAPLPVSALVEAAAAPHRRAGISVEIVAVSAGVQPTLQWSPEIVHGLGNLIQNAVDFARTVVRIAIAWDGANIGITISDDGPGISADVMSALGEPYTTSRPDDGGMGLGIFIAKTLLEHTGASVAFANRPAGGCEVAINWRRALLPSSAASQDTTGKAA